MLSLRGATSTPYFTKVAEDLGFKTMREPGHTGLATAGHALGHRIFIVMYFDLWKK
jgi:hypothetical protein